MSRVALCGTSSFISEALAVDTDDKVRNWISNRSEASDLELDKKAERARFGPLPESK